MKFIERAEQDLKDYEKKVMRYGKAKDTVIKLNTAIEMAKKNNSDKQLGVAYKDAISELYQVKAGPELRQLLTETLFDISSKKIKTIDFIPAKEIEDLQLEITRLTTEKNELALTTQNFELIKEKHNLELENSHIKLQFEIEKNKILEEKYQMAREANNVLTAQNEKYENVINSITGLMQQLILQQENIRSNSNRNQFFSNSPRANKTIEAEDNVGELNLSNNQYTPS